ncbi:glycosyltransferase family 4 protein [Pseudoalteromonas sp. T1lg22]|uniref:glycosyltransferase family 4 protein n=1 Tax=Pseudoalteromonas sp. T1lg22 TaxID=2077096 RepID=UPI000CF65C26|nr:glycosyltransferase family 4 protein [Pseudoalteromonas sp. T1lg22]
MKIFVIGVLPSSLTNFRGDLLKELSSKVEHVFALSSGATDEEVVKISSLGCTSLDYRVSRNGLDPIEDLKTLKDLKSLLTQIEPLKVLSYTIKPIIWGGLASRGKNVEHYAMVTGLGYAFQSGGVLRNSLAMLVKTLYKAALRDSKAVIFQNPDNMKVFVDCGIVPLEKCHLVNGSGVNLDKFTPVSLPNTNHFLLIARLLGDKGIREYYEAAKIVKDKYPHATFTLVGPEDPSPNGIQLTEVNQWVIEGVINYRGALSDVRPSIAASRFFVLPSYHEGVPRTVLEAMAMQRPILTTDVPGCRETVVNGENGWLVEKANAWQLAEKMIWMIEHPKQIEKMATKSLELVKEKFDVHKVNAEIIKIMGLVP